MENGARLLSLFYIHRICVCVEQTEISVAMYSRVHIELKSSRQVIVTVVTNSLMQGKYLSSVFRACKLILI